MKLSNRIINMQESPIRKLVPFAEHAKKEGKKVYHLNIGQPDIETPKNFMHAVKNFDEKILEYTFSQGIPDLIQAIVKYYEKYDMNFEKDDVLITNGGSEAIFFALVAVADNDDEVLVPEPFYTNYNGFAAAVGVKVIPITTIAEESFHLPSRKKIQDLIGPKTKAILLSNPGNPTGVVYSKQEVYVIADIAKQNNLYIIADEVYREFVYDNLEYTSFGNIKEIENNVIIVDSVSKRFSACGARIGAVISKNKELIAQIMKLCQGRLCCPTLEQIGAIELYDVSDDYFRAVLKEYQKRRDVVCEGLKQIPEILCEKPMGAFYVMARLPVVNAEDFVIWMLKDFFLNNETVMLAPAEGFYATPGLGIDEVRIAYILNEQDLKKSMEILKIALEQYPNKKQVKGSSKNTMD